MKIPVLASLLLATVGCGTESSPPPSPPEVCGAGQEPSTIARALGGALTYDRVPVTDHGLDYSAIARQSIRGAEVDVLAGGALLASSSSDDQGHYSIHWTGPSKVAVRVSAATADPSIRIEDNTAGNALYSMESCVETATATTVDLHAASGWGGSAYTGPRTSGPFAILDTLYTASHAFIAERPVVFPPVSVSWHPRNGRDVDIGGAHYDPTTSRIYLQGAEDIDTDEFDSHVVVHEWGHHVINQLSRSDDRYSVPIGHGFGIILDPRYAWNEGAATAVAAIALFPEAVWTGTFGPQQAGVNNFDAENDDRNGVYDECPGWFGENSVVHILYDLFDPSSSSESFDAVSLPLGELYDVLVGPQRTTESFTTIFSFLDAIKSAHPTFVAQVDAVSTHYGIGPVADAWGTDETNDGSTTTGECDSSGADGLLPVYRLLQISGPPVQVVLAMDISRWSIDLTRFAYFVGDGSQVSLIADSGGAPVVLQLFERGVLKRTAEKKPDGTWAVEGWSTSAGTTYTVAVSGTATGPYQTTVALGLTSP